MSFSRVRFWIRLSKNPYKLGFLLLATIVALRCAWEDTKGNVGKRKLQLLHLSKINIDPRKEYLIKKVFQVDEIAAKNVIATLEGAHASVELVGNDHIIVDNFQAVPLSATVDRRPLIVRKQMNEDPQNDGSTLGCALTAATFVSNLADVNLRNNKWTNARSTCHVCFQFSNREDSDNFVPGNGFEELNGDSRAKKCFSGQASVHKKFVGWQKHTDVPGRDFSGYGYPYTIDCALPNGIKELTCREISKLQNEIKFRDDIQAISLHTQFTLNGHFDEGNNNFLVNTDWPWTAVMSHDDDRSKIANSLPEAWNDIKSKYVPSSPQEVKFVHVEGPVYDQSIYLEQPSLQSMVTSDSSHGGIHPGLLVSLFHFIRNAPKSTHMIAVVDGQMNRTKSRILHMLHMKVSKLYPKYGTAIFSDVDEMKKLNRIPISDMDKVPRKKSDMTLMELLYIRKINIVLVPVATPAYVFERTVCGGQYTFTPYLAARYAADYNVMMYADGDTAMLEKDRTLQEILYRRFFSDESSKCVGHRMRLIEQYVPPGNEEHMLECVHNLATDKSKWYYATNNCMLAIGHIVARTDSIYALNVHHPDTLPDHVPSGVKSCSQGLLLNRWEFIELHLRDRQRKAECICPKTFSRRMLK